MQCKEYHTKNLELTDLVASPDYDESTSFRTKEEKNEIKAIFG